MSFRTLCLSIHGFQLSLHHPALAEPLPLHLQLAFLPQRFLSQNNSWSIVMSLHCWGSAFLVVTRPKASFCIASCTMPQALGLSLLQSRSCLHLLDDVIGWTALLICHICLLEVAKSTFLEHWPLKFALTLLLGEMLDVARYGQYGGKLHLLCQGCYIYSSWTKQNLPFDCQ